MGGQFCNKLQVLEMTAENVFSWTIKADLPEERWDAASAVHEGRLYVMGGDMEEVANVVIIYDPVNDTWVAGPDADDFGPWPRATILDGKIHLVTRGAVLEHREGAWVEVAQRYSNTYYHTSASLLLG